MVLLAADNKITLNKNLLLTTKYWLEFLYLNFKLDFLTKSI